MPRHALQEQRYELKYLIPETLGLLVRDFVRGYLVLDSFAAPEPDCAYDNHSIYFDSPRLETYRAAINGDTKRFKLRLRYYDAVPASPVFFEVKRKVNDIIHKKRCRVRREAVQEIITGQPPEDAHLFAPGEREFGALLHFCELMEMLHARPKAHIAYSREAWVSEHDNSVRVTIDREVRSEPQFDATTRLEMADPVYLFDRQAVLELKFTNRFPNWLHELVQTFGLVRTGGAKYADGIRLRGEREYRGPSGIAA